VTFDEWLKDRKPEIERVICYNPDYIWAYFENAYEHGKAASDSADGGICPVCGMRMIKYRDIGWECPGCHTRR